MTSKQDISHFFARSGLLIALLLFFSVVGGAQLLSGGASAMRLRSDVNLASPSLALITPEEVTVVEDPLLDSLLDVGQLPPEVTLPDNPLIAYVTTGSSVLNLRSGPGVTFTLMGQVSGGTVMVVLEKDENWCKVIYDNQVAYVSTEYVRLMSTDEYEKLAASGNPLGEEIVNVAKQYLGVPYVYGGRSPSGFDCSGLTSYVFAQCGYNITRTATTQLGDGIPVARADLQPGDLVFFRNPGETKPVSHVGIYSGNGEFIHSPNYNTVVRFDSLETGYYADTYVDARRVI